MASNQLLSQTDRYFRFIFLISSFCGFFPYRFKNDRFQKVLPLCFYSVIVVILLATIAIGSICRYCYFSKFFTGVLQQGICILWYTAMSLLTLTGVITSPLRALAINKILHSLREVDRLFYAKNDWITLSSDWMEKNIVGLACILVYIVYYHYNIGTVAIHLTGLYFFILSVGVFLSASQFSATALLVRKRLTSLYYFLKQVRLDGNVSLAIIEIKHLVYLQNQMCDVASLLNESFTVLLTVHIASAFMVTVLAFFYLTISSFDLRTINISYFLSHKSLSEAVEKIRIIIAILYFSTIWQICTCSIKISQKINKFNLLLYRFMVKDETKKLLNEEQLRLHVATKREVIFTACGFFKLDYSLIHSMVAAVTSYIIMLKQFYVNK
ncbi:Gustatory receptor 27b [Halyomorpha halys]|nr:Gustatory receptor 27b [Halyomorpha halys]